MGERREGGREGGPLNFRGSFKQGRPETKFARHSTCCKDS